MATSVAASVTPETEADVAIFVPFTFIECVMNAVEGKFPVGAEVSGTDALDRLARSVHNFPCRSSRKKSCEAHEYNLVLYHSSILERWSLPR